MSDAYARTPQGLWDRTLQRLEAVERRLSRALALPGRLSTLGQEVTDWNDATEVGFYWGRPSIPNSPEMSTSSFSGVVYYDGHSSPARLMQEARVLSTTPSRVATTWRRVFANGVWGAWHDNGTGPFTTRISGAVSAPGNTTTVAYSYTPPAVARDRVAILSSTWLVQQTLASGAIDFRLRASTNAITFYRYSTGIPPSQSVTLTGSVLIPANAVWQLDLTLANNSPTATHATADSSFFNLSIVLI